MPKGQRSDHGNSFEPSVSKLISSARCFDDLISLDLLLVNFRSLFHDDARARARARDMMTPESHEVGRSTWSAAVENGGAFCRKIRL